MAQRAIAKVHGRRVWDSRGRPTVEVEVALAGGIIGRAIAPAGASTGSGEAVDLRDGGAAFGGLDVRRAVANVNEIIAPALAGRALLFGLFVLGILAFVLAGILWGTALVLIRRTTRIDA